MRKRSKVAVDKLVDERVCRGKMEIIRSKVFP